MEDYQAQTDLINDEAYAETDLTNAFAYASAAAYAKAQKTLLRLIDDAGGEMTRRDILRAMTYLCPKDLEDALQSLVEQELIEAVEIPGKGRLRQGYRTLPLS